MKYYEIIKINGEPPEKIVLLRDPSNNVRDTIKKNAKVGRNIKEITIDEFLALFSIIQQRSKGFYVLQPTKGIK